MRDLRSRSPADAKASVVERDTACFCIDLQSDKILAFNSIASDLFGFESFDLNQEYWWRVLGTTTRTANPLDIALRAGVKVALPPTWLKKPDGSELVISGQIGPGPIFGKQSALLDLQLLSPPGISELASQVGESDTVAVLGIDQIHYSQHWRVRDTDRFVMDLRSSLLEIVRSEDIISLPQGCCLTIILKGIGLESSKELSRAFLSHLKPISEYYGAGVAEVRHTLGLAQGVAGKTALQTIVAANNALLCSQKNPASERIKVAEKWDGDQLYGFSHVSDGVFSDNAGGENYFLFLSELTALARSPVKPEDYIDAVTRLILGQAGVCKLGIFRAYRDGTFSYLAGGSAMDSGVQIMTEDVALEHFPAELTKSAFDIHSPEIAVFPDGARGASAVKLSPGYSGLYRS